MLAIWWFAQPQYGNSGPSAYRQGHYLPVNAHSHGIGEYCYKPRLCSARRGKNIGVLGPPSPPVRM